MTLIVEDRFEVYKTIAQGGFGEVMMGWDRWSDDAIIMKMTMEKKMHDDEVQILREIQ